MHPLNKSAKSTLSLNLTPPVMSQSPWAASLSLPPCIRHRAVVVTTRLLCRLNEWHTEGSRGNVRPGASTQHSTRGSNAALTGAVTAQCGNSTDAEGPELVIQSSYRMKVRLASLLKTLKPSPRVINSNSKKKTGL